MDAQHLQHRRPTQSLPGMAGRRAWHCRAWSFLLLLAAQPAAAVPVPEILSAAGVPGGVVVLLGAGLAGGVDGLQVAGTTLVQVLDTDLDEVVRLRRALAAQGGNGTVTAEWWDGQHLPYTDSLVNVVAATGALPPAVAAEAGRVLAPLGVLLLRQGDAWVRQPKPWPDDIDDWTHYLHGAGNNAVARDERVGPPRALQWVGSPRWSRHHDKMASLSALVSAGGRLFYIFDEGPTASVLLPSQWALIARDAFNGVVLWKHPVADWQTRLWPLKSGPAQLPRRLVASRDAVYATLGIAVPVTALDAATGRIERVYVGTEGTEEILLDDGVLFLVVDGDLDVTKYTDAKAVERPWWNRRPVSILAVAAADARVLWRHESPVVPLTLAADGARVVFHDGERVVALARDTGKPLWSSEPVPLAARIMSFFAPTLVLHGGVVLFAGGEESGLVKSTGGAVKADTLTALDAADGRQLWRAEHAPSGYSSPEDLFVIGDTVWFGSTSNPTLPGTVTGLDVRSGTLRRKFDPDVNTYWFHHRCHRGKATTRYLMVSRTGIEFIDPERETWAINHWVRGGCVYGIMPANGLVYTPPHSCACFPESKLFGFNALSAAVRPPGMTAPEARLQTGPAYGSVPVANPVASPSDWPTYRGDNRRSGANSTPLTAALTEAWRRPLGGRLSAATVAEGAVFAAAVDRHVVHCLDAATGEPRWAFVAGGRVDSPPTIHGGAAIFGCADGWVYCLRAADGALAWRCRAAPDDSRLVAFEQLESVWPVPGSVLVQDGLVYATAGRSMFLDGGMRFCRIDVRSGRLVDEQVLDDRDPVSGENLQSLTRRLTLPVALPDVLSSDGRHVYMRSQVFGLDGQRREVAPHSDKLGEHAAVQEGETAHLFASAGFLDDSWFHRAYWLHGRSFEGGWNGYYLAGRNVPAGKMLVVDGQAVYGYGRQPRYYRWTVPMEYHLFAAPLGGAAAAPAPPEEGSIVRVEKSETLVPANTALTVAAWVRSEAASGVVLARGGGVMGYALHLHENRPRFTVCVRNRRASATGPELPPGTWVHLAGILTEDAQLLVAVNGTTGNPVAAPGLLPGDPADALQIGGDEGSSVGAYEQGGPFRGDIADVRLYRGGLPKAALRALALKDGSAAGGEARLVMHHTFAGGTARDVSGAGNHGSVTGAVPVAPPEGVAGRALRFAGLLPGQTAPATAVRFAWSTPVPIRVRAMAVADSTLAVAGPEDVLDEPAALRLWEEAGTAEALQRQADLLDGTAGGVLRLVSGSDGKALAEYRVPAAPVWDGLAAAGGRLFLVGMDGTLRCYAPAPPE